MDPFGFLADIESTVASIHVEIMDLYSFLNTKSLINIAEACGGGNIFSSTNYTLYSLGQNLAYFQGTLAAVAELSGCSSISPIFRRLLFGTPCTKSVDGLGCLYFTLLSISMLGFVILSTRAALFNPVIRGRRSKKREKEFSDYKQFMSKFYDTSNWDLEWVPHIEDTVESNIIPQLPISDSEDTRSTPDISLCASDETNDDAASADIVLAPTTVTSTEGSVFVNLAAPDDVKGDDDSYDSTYSSDDGEIQSTGSHSNISRLFLRRRNQYPDELLSSMSSSSLLGRIFMRGSARDGLGGIELYNHESDLGNDSQQDNDNDDDSAVGVILTPPHMRYPLNLRRLARSQGTQPRSVRISDFEDCPLTPSLGQPSSKQRNEQHVASIQMFTTLPRSSIL